MGKIRDLDIRRVLRAQLQHRHAHEPDAVILDELGICQGDSRVDLAVINGLLNGFEIKSERDTLERLPVQEAAYSRVFDEVTLVCGQNHLCHVQSLIPHWWHLAEATMEEERVAVRTVHVGGRNPQPDPHAVVQLLWRREALAALQELGLDKGHRTKARKTLWRVLAEAVTPLHLGAIVRRFLKARGDWRSAGRRRSNGASSRPDAKSQHFRDLHSRLHSR